MSEARGNPKVGFDVVNATFKYLREPFIGMYLTIKLNKTIDD